MFSFGPSRRSWTRIGLVLAHLLVPPGLWFAIRIGRPRFVGLGLYVLVTILVVDLLMLLGRPVSETVTLGIGDVRVLLILLFGNAGVLALVGPGLLFYVGSTMLLVVVLLRAFALDVDGASMRTDLAMVCSTSVLLVISQVFTIAYYAKRADTINHTTTIMVLREGGNLGAISFSRYFFFSAFHVLGNTGLQLSQLEPRLSLGILMIVLVQIGLLAAYLFFYYWSGSHSLALTAAVLMSINSSFVHYGSVVHYQSMSFTLFALFLYLLYRRSWVARDVVVASPILVTWIGTHHVSVVMAIIMLTLPMASPAVRTLLRRRKSPESSSVYMFSVFCLMFGIYWVLVTGRFSEIIGWILFSSPAAEGISNNFYLVETHRTLNTLLSESIPYLLSSLHYALLLAFAAVGIVAIYTSDLLEERRWRLIRLGVLPAASVYFPNRGWSPLEGVLAFSRWRIMVLPFLLLVPAAGFIYGLRPDIGTSLRTVGVVLITGALVFTTVTSGMTHPSLTDLAGIHKEPREYISNEELDATAFVYRHQTGEQRVYSRNDLYVYQHQYAWASNEPYGEEAYAQIQASSVTRKFVIEPGLTVVSVEALRDQGILVQIVESDSISEDVIGSLDLSVPVHASEYRWDRWNESVVYTSGAVVIHHKSPSNSSVATV